MERVVKKVNRAKREVRSELSFPGGWSLNNYANKFNPLEPINDTCDRADGRYLSKKEFIEKYERPNIPVVLTHVTDNWLAQRKWLPEKLVKKYRNQKFKCGEDDEGYNVKLKMKYYMPYCTHLCHLDDSPMYIFDGSFADQAKKQSLLQDYEVPTYFREDLFKYTSERRRPPYRWIVIGPSRSGTGIHIDPLGTSAWNALLRGHKRWCLFPPSTPKQLLKVKSGENKKNKGEAITWFDIIYPRTNTPDWPSQYPKMEILQKPGETVFVPSGWWHVVINLDFTVAVTQNFSSTTNFPIVWVKTVRGRPRLSKKWHEALKAYRPDLASIADEIDRRPDRGLSLLSIQSDASYSSSSSSSSSSGSDDRTSRSSSVSSTRSDGTSLNSGLVNGHNQRWAKSNGVPAVGGTSNGTVRRKKRKRKMSTALAQQNGSAAGNKEATISSTEGYLSPNHSPSNFSNRKTVPAPLLSRKRDSPSYSSSSSSESLTSPSSYSRADSRVSRESSRSRRTRRRRRCSCNECVPHSTQLNGYHEPDEVKSIKDRMRDAARNGEHNRNGHQSTSIKSNGNAATHKNGYN